MNSLFAKILLWFWGTVAVAVVGSAIISGMTVNQNIWDAEAPASRRMSFQLEEARAVYEEGGRPALQRFLDTLKRIYLTEGVLTDESGHDLLTGKDYSPQIAKFKNRPFISLSLGGATMARMTDDGRYWFISIVPRTVLGAWFITPAHLFWLAVAVALCWWFALNLTSPVRALQKAVERFGHGELRARVNSRRHDELGDLANAFDKMAGRIETLLDAEKRLLLDISHELRSPLARLGVAVELARSSAEREDLESALNRIEKESERLNALVGQLLQVTRAEGDPARMKRDPIRLDQLVEQVADDTQIEAEARECRVEYRAGAPLTIGGDPELIRRAVENVTRNAVRYSPKGTVVDVSLAREGSKAVLRIRDRGPGVPEESLGRIFDPFYRVEPDRGRASGGIGLGLSITRRAVELHGGAIRAANAIPGLEVVMEIPITEPAAQTAA
jgi:two-component system sensor histidine kinase CpxA